MTKARSNGKHPGGRPSKYDPKYCAALIKFFNIDASREVEVTFTNKKGETWSKCEEKANAPPLLINFSRKIGVSLSTLYVWAKTHAEFSDALEEAKALQESHLVTCGFLGLSNPAITALILKSNHGYVDKTEVAHSGEVSVNAFLEGVARRAGKYQDRANGSQANGTHDNGRA